MKRYLHKFIIQLQIKIKVDIFNQAGDNRSNSFLYRNKNKKMLSQKPYEY